MILAGTSINNVNTVVLLLEMAIQEIIVVTWQKNLALISNIFQVTLHPLLLVTVEHSPISEAYYRQFMGSKSTPIL